MPVKPVVLAPEPGRGAVWLAVDRVRDVRDHRSIEDVVHGGTVEPAPIGGAAYPVALRDQEIVVGHYLHLAVIDPIVIP